MAFTFNATRRASATVALALVLFLRCSWAAPTLADRVALADRLQNRNTMSAQEPNQHLRSGRTISNTLRVKLSECPNKEGLQELQERFKRDEQLNNRLIKDFSNEYIVVNPTANADIDGRIPSRDYSVQCNSKSGKCGSDAMLLLTRTVLILQEVDKDNCEYEITAHNLTVGCYCNKKDADITAAGPKDQE